jgi:hypothetical protein
MQRFRSMKYQDGSFAFQVRERRRNEGSDSKLGPLALIPTIIFEAKAGRIREKWGSRKRGPGAH